MNFKQKTLTIGDLIWNKVYKSMDEKSHELCMKLSTFKYEIECRVVIQFNSTFYNEI